MSATHSRRGAKVLAEHASDDAPRLTFATCPENAARRRAQESGVEVTFVECDVASLRRGGVGPDVSFILDVECFNHLNDTKRANVGREVNTIASPNATMLLLVWARGRRGPLPSGVSNDDLTRAFPGWGIADETPYGGELPRAMKNIAPRWVRLWRH